LKFIRERLLRGQEDRAAILDMYRQVRARKKIHDDDTNPIISILCLSGLTKVFENFLWVRNRIYFRAFDKEWIKANMPDAEKRRQKAAYRRGMIIPSILALIVTLVFGLYMYAYEWEHVEYYSNYAKRYGIMEGVGKQLTDDQVHHREISFKFIRKGRYNPVWKVQAVNSKDELTDSRLSVGLYVEQMLSREVQWEFVLDSTGKIVYEKVYNKYDQMIWGRVYSPPLKG